MYCYEYDTGTRSVQYIKNDFKTEQLSFTSNVTKFSLYAAKKNATKKICEDCIFMYSAVICWQNLT